MLPAFLTHMTSEKGRQWHLTPEHFCSAYHQKCLPPGQCLPHLHTQEIRGNKKETLSSFKNNLKYYLCRELFSFLWGNSSLSKHCVPLLECLFLFACIVLFVCRSPHTYYIINSNRAGVRLNHLRKSRVALLSFVSNKYSKSVYR